MAEFRSGSSSGIYSDNPVIYLGSDTRTPGTHSVYSPDGIYIRQVPLDPSLDVKTLEAQVEQLRSEKAQLAKELADSDDANKSLQQRNARLVSAGSRLLGELKEWRSFFLILNTFGKFSQPYNDNQHYQESDYDNRRYPWD